MVLPRSKKTISPHSRIKLIFRFLEVHWLCHISHSILTYNIYTYKIYTYLLYIWRRWLRKVASLCDIISNRNVGYEQTTNLIVTWNNKLVTSQYES